MEVISKAVYEYLNQFIGEEDIRMDEPMSRHTTFRVGGNADVLIQISREEQLGKLIPYFHSIDMPYFIVGNGSNLLVGDKGYRGAIVQISDRMNHIVIEDTQITAEAGCLMSQLAKAAEEHSLTGLEFAAGIPGTIGGGVTMNAGAYDGELKQVVTSVKVMNDQGEVFHLSNEDMEFGYRSSVIKNRPFTVLQVTLALPYGNREEISAKMTELNQRRRDKQPLQFPSAGSTFKRPDGYFAGKLIMDAGLRGYSIGGACVSEKHCGFIINKGGATAADIAELIAEVQEQVKAKFGVTLEKEVIFLGDF